MSQPEENTHAPLTPDGASDQDRLAQALEREIERIREARPHLSSRLDRASNFLLLQLASPPRQRPVKVRIGTNGRRPRFLVRSLTSGGVVYCVTANTFQCSCPDALRRDQGRGCKHSLAVYILWRASRTQKRGCSACDGGWVFRGEEILDPETGEVVEAINPVRCTRCGDSLSHAFVQQWLEDQRWIFARSRASNPHWYCLRREADDEATFERIVEFIREYGSGYRWWGRVYDQLPLGEWCYWSMGAAPKDTVLINRKSLEQVRLDELRNAGGSGVQWRWLHGDIDERRR